MGDAKPFGLLITLLWLLAIPAAAQTPTGSQTAGESVFSAAPPSGLTWEVSQRSRYAALLNQFRPGLSGDDQALVFRTTLRLEWPLGRTRIVGEIQDARAYLTDDQSNVSTALVNAIDLLQAHIRFGDGPAARAFVPDVQADASAWNSAAGASSHKRPIAT